MNEKPQCCERVFHQGAFSSVRCTRTATKEHEGNPYCSQHHPPTVEARRRERTQRWDDEWAAKMAESERVEKERKETARRAACFPELLEALNEVTERLTVVSRHSEDLVAIMKADKAMRKATGEQP